MVCDGPWLLPKPVLWILRVAAIGGGCVMLFGPAPLSSYGRAALFASSGVGALGAAAAIRRGTPRQRLFARLLTAAFGIALLSGAVLMLCFEC